MKKTMIGLVVILLLFFGAWMLFEWDFTSYEKDLVLAQSALDQLEEVVNGDDIALLQESSFHFVSVAHAAETSMNDQVSVLTKKVVKHTEKAIKKIQKHTDVNMLYPVLQQINTIQERTIDVLSDALDVVDEDSVVEDVVEGLESTAFDSIQVKGSLDVVKLALDQGEAAVALEIDTNSGIFNLFTGIVAPVDDGKITAVSTPILEPEPVPVPEEGKITAPGEDTGDDDVVSVCGRAQVAMNMNQVMGDSDVQKKMEQIQNEYAYCKQNSGGEKCNMTKVKGLCIALQSKVQNGVRQMEKTAKGGR